MEMRKNEELYEKESGDTRAVEVAGRMHPANFDMMHLQKREFDTRPEMVTTATRTCKHTARTHACMHARMRTQEHAARQGLNEVCRGSLYGETRGSG